MVSSSYGGDILNSAPFPNGRIAAKEDLRHTSAEYPKSFGF